MDSNTHYHSSPALQSASLDRVNEDMDYICDVFDTAVAIQWTPPTSPDRIAQQLVSFNTAYTLVCAQTGIPQPPNAVLTVYATLRAARDLAQYAIDFRNCDDDNVVATSNVLAASINSLVRNMASIFRNYLAANPDRYDDISELVDSVYIDSGTNTLNKLYDITDALAALINIL